MASGNLFDKKFFKKNTLYGVEINLYHSQLLIDFYLSHVTIIPCLSLLTIDM